jgi:hypothetical protein
MAKIAVGEVEYDFDPADVTNDEGIAVEKIMGCTFDQWNTSLAEGSMQAMTALVWLLQHRENPALRIADVHFKMGDIRGIVEDDEATDTDGVVAEVIPGGRSAVVDPKEEDSTPVEEASITEG